MLLPGVNLKIKDGALGLTADDVAGLHVKIGVSSKGPINQLLAFTDIDLIRDTYGLGLLPEAAAASLQLSGGAVLLMRILPAAASTLGTPTLVGMSTASLVPTGTVADKYNIKVKITKAGATLIAATAAFQYSLDDGRTYSEEKAVPTTGIYLITEVGITLTWTTGTFVIGDIWSFSTVPPVATISEWMAATDLVLADPTDYEWIHYITTNADAAMAAAVEAKMLQAENEFNYLFGIVDDIAKTSGQTDAQFTTAQVAAYAAYTGVRTGIFSGDAKDVSPLTGLIVTRPASWRMQGRLASVPVQEDIGRVASGPIPGFTSLIHDERATPGLYPAGFTTMRTFKRRAGYYSAGGQLKTTNTSDFRRLANRRVMNKACRVGYDRLLELVKDDVAVDENTGFILETEARNIEASLESVLRTKLLAPGNASSIQVRVKRDNNILVDKTVYVKLRIVPVGYIDFIEADIAFRNPALEPPIVQTTQAVSAAVAA